VTSRAAALRYGRALFDVVLQERSTDPERAGQELAAFAALVREHEALAHALGHPALPPARKRAIVQTILQRTGASTSVAKLLLLLAERDRLTILPDLVDAYRRRLMEHQRIVQAEVTTAVRLGEDRRAALERSLARTTGWQVTLAARVDPAIIGGAVTRVGSVVYDGSVARQLERLKEKLAEA
jgi:F-type H+-transporting ATPase subunit delta